MTTPTCRAPRETTSRGRTLPAWAARPSSQVRGSLHPVDQHRCTSQVPDADARIAAAGKIFIGGLDGSTTKQSLTAYCAQW